MGDRYFDEELPEVDEVAIIKMEHSAAHSSRKRRVVAGSALVLLALFSFYSVRMQEQTAVVPTTTTSYVNEAAEIAELTINFPTDEQLSEAFPLVTLAGEQYQSMADVEAESRNQLWVDMNQSDQFVDSYHRIYMDETPCTWSSLEPIVAVEVVANRYESADAALAKFYEEAVNVNVEMHDESTLLYPYTWRNHYDTMDRYFDATTGYGLDCAIKPKYMSWVSADRLEEDTIYYIRATVSMRQYNPILLRQFEKNMVEYIQNDWEMPAPNMLHYSRERDH